VRTLYCFVPSNVPLGTLIPDSYLTRTLRTVDDLYRIDLTTDTDTRLFSADGGTDTPSVDGTNVFVSGQSLYFVDASDRALFMSPLP
jgi:hypothetical protein